MRIDRAQFQHHPARLVVARRKAAAQTLRRVAVILPGGTAPVRHMGRHDLVGEYGQFGGVRSSTLVAEDEATLLSIDYPRFQAMCFRFPSVMHGLLEAAVRRLRAAEARLAERDVPTR